MKRHLIVLAVFLAPLQPRLSHAEGDHGDVSRVIADSRLPATTAVPALSEAEKTRSESKNTTSEPPKPRVRSSTSWEALKGGLIGGTIGGVVSAGLNYYVLPFPDSAKDNAIGHGITGFICGLVSGVIGILIYAHHNSSEDVAR